MLREEELKRDFNPEEPPVDETARPDRPQEAAAEQPTVLQSEYEEAVRERDQFRALAQRVQADFVNYRKRVDAERDETRRLATKGLLVKLVQVLDNFELALREDITRDIDQRWVEGVRAVKRSLDSVLAAEGIEPFTRVGDGFDPRLHEAIARIPTVDSKPDTVLKVHRAGYKLHGEVIRPAMVDISTSPPDDAGRAPSSDDIENQRQTK
ncbi:MAG: nucleotide exchange factor GrpE [Chloroflexi bacterium]|nr:nucleotide exchange factor GrpE [Chloroflexota bacterium]